MTTLVLAGAVANKAGQGGEAWVRLSWLRGLQRLGFDVTFVEQVDPDRIAPDAIGYFDDVLTGHTAALVNADGATLTGLASTELLDRLDDAAALIDISGSLSAATLRDRVGRAVFVDIDPGFTQFWAVQGALGEQLAAYDDHVTIAENIHDDDCTIPTGGLDWLTTRQPVVLGDWPAGDGGFDRFTTVATWRHGFGRVTADGRTFGLKLDEFRKVAALPRRTGLPFELALAIHPAEVDDIRLLDDGGWTRVDAADVARTPEDFRDYVTGSGAEFSVAQGIYVQTCSGWFSDRTARYLAAGRPVLVQDTGFSRRLPVGEGLLTFTDPDSAAAGAKAIAVDHGAHAQAAREIAERHFDAEVVLGRLCDQLGLQP